MPAGAGVAGVERALSALSLERLAANWSGLGALLPGPALAGVGAGVPGTAGDLTELVELVLLRILLSIPRQLLADSFTRSTKLYLCTTRQLILHCQPAAGAQGFGLAD